MRERTSFATMRGMSPLTRGAFDKGLGRGAKGEGVTLFLGLWGIGRVFVCGALVGVVVGQRVFVVGLGLEW